VVHKLTGATSSSGPGPYYSVVCSSQFPVLLNWIKNVCIALLQTSKTDNNALDNDAVYNLKLRIT
jgi:hypothetical protein